MKKTLITAAALAACAGTQLFAQNVKQSTITFALTQQKQVSVSDTSKTANNGTWEAPPTVYKTATAQLKTANILQAMSLVLHGTPSYYSSKAQLVLVQGELSGFFNLDPELAAATVAGGIDGTNSLQIGKFDSTSIGTTLGGIVPRPATGRHFEENPVTGGWPPGHHQPWGQIFVQDLGKSPMLCENVTFFFAITVQECYDCFYLNSFISDATFKFSNATSGGPPCCDVPQNLTGNGKDRYYMTLSFDNTLNNPYLSDLSPGWIGGWGQKLNSAGDNYNPYKDIVGLNPFPPSAAVDGLEADFLPYTSSIRAQVGTFNPYVLRFMLNGVLTYTWKLTFVDKSDVFPNFIGSASYPNSGHGFVGLYCSLFTGTVSIAEKAVKSSSCCLDLPWYDSWFGVGWDQIGNSAARLTPVNVMPDLSYHAYWDEEYEPGEQWGTNPDSPTGNIP
jgi:hypothetical protein